MVASSPYIETEVVNETDTAVQVVVSPHAEKQHPYAPYAS